MEEKIFDVLVVGELNVDIIFNRIEKFPEVGKEILVKHMTLTLGSSSAIFASNLSIMGTRVAFLGKTGDDGFAETVISSLNDKDVYTGFITRSSKLNTGATVVMNFGEERAMLTYPGSMAELSAAEINDHMLKSAAHLHVSSIFLQPALKPGITGLFARAKKLGLTTSLDTQWDPDEKWNADLPALLPAVDVFLPNMQEFLCLTATNDMESGISKVQDIVNYLVIKDGSNGAFLWNRGKLIHQPAFINNKVVDCIGAGDSFDAGFIRQFLLKKPLQDCLAYAALMGAINTTASGGTTAFSSIESIRKTAVSRFSYQI